MIWYFSDHMTTPDDWVNYGELLEVDKVAHAFLVAEPRLVKANPGYYSLTPGTISAYVTLIPPSSLESFASLSGWTISELKMLSDPNSDLVGSLAWNKETPMYFFARAFPKLKHLTATHQMTQTAHYYLKVRLLKLCFELASKCGPSNAYVPRAEPSLMLRGYLQFDTPSWHEAKARSVISEQLKLNVPADMTVAPTPLIPAFIRPLPPLDVPSYLRDNPQIALSIPFPVGLSRYPKPEPFFSNDNGATVNGGLASMDWNAPTSASTSGAKAPSGVPNPHIPVQIRPVTWHQPNFGPRGVVPPPKGHGWGPGSNPIGPVFQPALGAPRAPFQHNQGFAGHGQHLPHQGQPVRPQLGQNVPVQQPGGQAPQNVPVQQPGGQAPPVPNHPVQHPPVPHGAPQVHIHPLPPYHHPPVQPPHVPAQPPHVPAQQAPNVHLPHVPPMALPDHPPSKNQPIIFPTLPTPTATSAATPRSDIDAIINAGKHPVQSQPTHPPVNVPITGYIPPNAGSFEIPKHAPVQKFPTSLPDWEEFVKVSNQRRKEQLERICAGRITPPESTSGDDLSAIFEDDEDPELYNRGSALPIHPPSPFTRTIIAPNVPDLHLGDTSGVNHVPLAPVHDANASQGDNLTNLSNTQQIAYQQIRREGEQLQKFQQLVQDQAEQAKVHLRNEYEERLRQEREFHARRENDIIAVHNDELARREAQFEEEISLRQQATDRLHAEINQLQQEYAIHRAHRNEPQAAGALQQIERLAADLSAEQHRVAEIQAHAQSEIDYRHQRFLDEQREREEEFLQAQTDLKTQYDGQARDLKEQHLVSLAQLQEQLRQANFERLEIEYRLRQQEESRLKEVSQLKELHLQELQIQHDKKQQELDASIEALRTQYVDQLRRATAMNEATEADMQALAQQHKDRIAVLEKEKQDVESHLLEQARLAHRGSAQVQQVQEELVRVQQLHEEEINQKDATIHALELQKQQALIHAETAKIHKLEAQKADFEKKLAEELAQAKDNLEQQFAASRHRILVQVVDDEIAEAQDKIVAVRNKAAASSGALKIPLAQRSSILKAKYKERTKVLKTSRETKLQAIDQTSDANLKKFNAAVSRANKKHHAQIAEIQKTNAADKDKAIANVKAQYEADIQNLTQRHEAERNAVKIQVEEIEKQYKEEAKILAKQFQAEKVNLLTPEEHAEQLKQHEAKIRQEEAERQARLLKDQSTAADIAAEEAAAKHRTQLKAYEVRKGELDKAKKIAEEAKKEQAEAEARAEQNRQAYEKLQKDAAAQGITTEQLIAKHKEELRAEREKHVAEVKKLAEQQKQHLLVINGQLKVSNKPDKDERKKSGSLAEIRAAEYEKEKTEGEQRRKLPKFDKDPGGVVGERALSLALADSKPSQFVPPSVPALSGGIKLGKATQEYVASTLAKAQSEFDTKLKEAVDTHSANVSHLQSLISDREQRVLTLESMIDLVSKQSAKEKESLTTQLDILNREKNRLENDTRRLQTELQDVLAHSKNELAETRKELAAQRDAQVAEVRKLLDASAITNTELTHKIQAINDEYDAKIAANQQAYQAEQQKTDNIIKELRAQLELAMAGLRDRQQALVDNTVARQLVHLGPPSVVAGQAQYNARADEFNTAVHAHTQRQHDALLDQATALKSSPRTVPYNLRPRNNPLPSTTGSTKIRLKHALQDTSLGAVVKEQASLAKEVKAAEADATLPSAYKTLSKPRPGWQLPEGISSLIEKGQRALASRLAEPLTGRILSNSSTVFADPDDPSALEAAAIEAAKRYQLNPTEANKAAFDAATMLLNRATLPSEDETRKIRLEKSEHLAKIHIARLDQDPTYAERAPSLESAATESARQQILDHVKANTAPFTAGVAHAAAEVASKALDDYATAEHASNVSANSTTGPFVPIDPRVEEQAVKQGTMLSFLAEKAIEFKDALRTLVRGKDHVPKSDHPIVPINLKSKEPIGRAQTAKTQAQEQRQARREELRAQSQARVDEERAIQDKANDIRSQKTEALLARIQAARAAQQAENDAKAQLGTPAMTTNYHDAEVLRLQRAKEHKLKKEAEQQAALAVKKGRNTQVRSAPVSADQAISRQLTEERHPRQAFLHAVKVLHDTPQSTLYGSPKTLYLTKRHKGNAVDTTPGEYLGIVEATLRSLRNQHELLPDNDLDKAIQLLTKEGRLTPRLAQKIQAKLNPRSKTVIKAPRADVYMEDALPLGAQPQAVIAALENVVAEDPADRVDIVVALNNAAEAAAREPGANPRDAFNPVLANLQQGNRGNAQENMLFNMHQVASDDDGISLEDRINFLDVVAHAADVGGQAQLSAQALSLVRDLITGSYQKKDGRGNHPANDDEDDFLF